jgi:hypothetical protein
MGSVDGHTLVACAMLASAISRLIKAPMYSALAHPLRNPPSGSGVADHHPPRREDQTNAQR